MAKRRCLVLVGAAVAVAVLVGTVTVILLKNHGSQSGDGGGGDVLNPPDPTVSPPPSPTELSHFEHAAISCDSPRCAQIAKDILKKNGNVADAAIAALLCMGVIHSQSMGIGGGFLMVIYNATTKTSKVLNARETAPKAATENMFGGDGAKSQKGGKAVAIPGELKGYWELYKKMGGQVPWRDLFEPTIEICEKGFQVDSHVLNAMQVYRDDIKNEPSMAKIFVDPKTSDIWKLNDTIKRPQLAETLRIIANSEFGGDVLYDASLSNLSRWLVEDLQDFDGIITHEDMLNYRVSWSDPISVKVHGGYDLHTVRPPGSGILMAFIMRLLSTYKLSPESLKTDEDAARTYHLIAESFKHAFATRTKLGDPEDPEVREIVEELIHNLTVSDTYLNSVQNMIHENSTNNTWEYYGDQYYTPDDHGTAHLSLIAPNGDAIAVTSTVNLYFGARIVSPRTGIIYNDEMDDFSAPNITNYFGVPPSPNNFIRPGKRPLSSMTPAIFTDGKGQVRLAVGTAGGTKITTATTYVSLRNLWFNETIKEAIDARRIHHQLYPMEVQYEYGFLDQWVQGLKRRGHRTHRFNVGQSVTCAVVRGDNDTSLFANWDFRKPGSADGF